MRLVFLLCLMVLASLLADLGGGLRTVPTVGRPGARTSLSAAECSRRRRREIGGYAGPTTVTAGSSGHTFIRRHADCASERHDDRG